MFCLPFCSTRVGLADAGVVGHLQAKLWNMMQPMIQQLPPLQLTHDKTTDLGAHVSHGKGFSVNMTNIQRLSMLENWR